MHDEEASACAACFTWSKRVSRLQDPENERREREAREREERERKTTGHEPFALHAPIQWALYGYVTAEQGVV